MESKNDHQIQEDSVDYLDLGYQYAVQGNQNLAEKYFKLASDDGDGFASIALADLYASQGKMDLAEEWYRKESGDEDSCYGSGNNALAHFLVAQGREEEAWEYLRQVLFIDHADTAPYEGAMMLVLELLGEGKYWEKIKEDTFYLAYIFLDAGADENSLYFMEENLLRCINAKAPNAESAANILAELYLWGKYRVCNWYGMLTDNSIDGSCLQNKDKGLTILEELLDDDLLNIARSAEEYADSFEQRIDILGKAFEILEDRYSMLFDDADSVWELLEVFTEFLSDEDISDEDAAKLCGRIPNCIIWSRPGDEERFLYDEFYEKLSNSRITAILEEVANQGNDEAYYLLGEHYDISEKYSKAIENYKKYFDKEGCYCMDAAVKVSKYYRIGCQGITKSFEAALEWAVKALKVSEDGLWAESIGDSPTELKGMWKALFQRITTNVDPDVIEYFWFFAEDFEEYHTPDEYYTALIALSAFGDERAKKELETMNS